MTDQHEHIAKLVEPITNDVLSGAAELALQAISIFQTLLSEEKSPNIEDLRSALVVASKALVEAQPAMAPLFHLSNQILYAARQPGTDRQVRKNCQEALDRFEKFLCDSVSKIADQAFDLIPPGELVFAYSFSSTVVSCLLNARARGRYFRVACSESRPSLEGRKLATHLANGGIEVIFTFDSAMGLVLPNCSVAFMGCDCIGIPGLVNKVGSLLLALACRDMGIPLYALCGTEKFVTDDRLFEFENHERPGSEVWEEPPKGVKVLNKQFELIPLKYLSGVVTEQGIVTEQNLAKYLSNLPVHEALKVAPV